MVRGLTLFREHFQKFLNCYVLIGGTACDLVMTDAGLPFRATKDLDIVLCIEAIDKAFVEAFWLFIRAGGYQVQEKSSGKKQFYRFMKPEAENYPVMLELFSRKPDALPIADESHLTPIPVEEDVSSLSAILLDDGYYSFIHQGTQEVEGLSVVGADRLIPLKAKAWLDLTKRKEHGSQVDSKAIKKHKNDVFRIFQILDPDRAITVPSAVADDLKDFMNQVATEPIDLKVLGLGSTQVETVIAEIKKVYGID